MRAIEPARWLWAGAGCLIALGLVAVLLVSTAAAQTEAVEGAVRAEETAPADSRPTEAVTALPTKDPASGGIVGSTPPPEPTATEPGDVVEENPGESEGMPTERPDNEGVAPAVVVVVLWTADGGSVSDRTTVCVSEICQPVGRVGSGTKIEFERVVQGWHEISVFDAGSYEDGFSSVAVRPGQLVTVEVTLGRSSQAEPTPPPVANGPIRQPVQPVQVVDGDGDGNDDVARTSSARFAANAAGGEEPLLRVTSLPETGMSGNEPERGATEAMLMVAAVLMLSGAVALIRRRAA